MNDAFAVGGRERSSAEAMAVGAVDLGVIAMLIFVGQMTHPGTPLADPVGYVEAIVPFALGWVVAAGLADPYDGRAFDSPLAAGRITTLCWLAAANVGLVLRATPWFDGGVSGAFPIVITGFGLVFLLTWRIAFVVVRSRLRGPR